VLHAILLAGDRRGDDPLLLQTGVRGKALITIGDRALLTRVLDTLGQVRDIATITLVAPDHAEYRAAVTAANCAHALRWIAPASSPARSVAAALAQLDDDGPALLTTADHPLLTAAMVEALLAGATATPADVAVAVADAAEVARRFPGSRRTRYRLRGGAYCGTNLFLFQTPRGRAIAELWQRVEQHRKSPWRIVALLGPMNVAAVFLRLLSLEQALQRLSRRLRVHVQAVVLHGLPESAVDVDTPADLALVSATVAEREKP